jgi:hypothetical protein
MIVLSLCDRTGVMVQPWREVGYTCGLVDTQHRPGINRLDGGALTRVGVDVREFDCAILPAEPAIVFAFPPCTHLANSGNRHKRDKGLEALYEALGLVRRAVDAGEPRR